MRIREVRGAAVVCLVGCLSRTAFAADAGSAKKKAAAAEPPAAVKTQPAAIFLYDAAMRDAMLPRPALPFGGADKPLEGLYPDAVK